MRKFAGSILGLCLASAIGGAVAQIGNSPSAPDIPHPAVRANPRPYIRPGPARPQRRSYPQTHAARPETHTGAHRRTLATQSWGAIAVTMANGGTSSAYAGSRSSAYAAAQAAIANCASSGDLDVIWR